MARACRDFHALAGLDFGQCGIALANPERTKAANLDLVAALEGRITESNTVSTMTSRRGGSDRPVW